jgi:HAD domain in Swiss Army Knife RNA repair proteins
MGERIVFLDFDGVLNSRASIADNCDIAGLDPTAVVRLNRLAARANFVVCSSWRHGRSVKELQAILNGYGFRGHVCGKTPRAGGFRPGRGMEIKMWLDFAPLFNHEVESFVILDDDSDMDPVADRHIQTSFDDGLQDAHVDLALKMLT